MEHDNQPHIPKTWRSKLASAASRYPVITFAIILAVGMVGASAAFAYKANTSVFSASGGLNTAKVLPQPVAMPSKSSLQHYTAQSLKQYDGKDGKACYVAVNGKVYEIKNSQYWKDGQHTPSGGQGYCGADMSEAIKQSPHGTSKLSSLPQVGVYN